MAENKRVKFTLVFKFNFSDDIITYKTIRYCESLELMMFYADDWLEKYGEKYGEWFVVEIYEELKLVSLIVNDK